MSNVKWKMAMFLIIVASFRAVSCISIGNQSNVVESKKTLEFTPVEGMHIIQITNRRI